MLTGQFRTNQNRDTPPDPPVDRGAASRRPSFDPEKEPTGDLVHRAGKGDDQAWNQLLSRYGPMILRVAQRTGLNAADAADVQQATWIQLMRRVDQVRNPERIGPWLATTARRYSQRVSMAAPRHATVADPVAEFGAITRSGDDVEAIALRDEFEAALGRALTRLPVSYRQLLRLLTSSASPSYEEVARAMGLPIGSIGPMRARALYMLRRDPEVQCLRLATTKGRRNGPPPTFNQRRNRNV